jgi:peptidyl-dipeptidase A
MKIIAALVLCFTLSMVLEAQTSHPPTVAEAEAFMNKAEAQLAEISVKVNQATWVHDNFITEDTEALAADANDDLTALTTELVEQSKRFDGLQMPADLSRKFLLLKLSLTAPGPKDPALRKEMSEIAASLESDYGKGKYCPSPEKCLDITAIEKIMGESRDPNELKDLWVGWHAVGAPMRKKYARFVDLSNQGARDLGFKDTGVLWRAGYDMPPAQFDAEMDRQWERVRPLYLSLYTFVRAAVAEVWGGNCASGRADAGACAGESVGADVGRYFSDSRAAGKQQRLRSDGFAASAKARCEGHGEVRGEFLQISGVRTAAADLLGTVVVC